MRLVRIDNPLDLESRVVMEVPAAHTIGDLRAAQFDGDLEWGFIINGRSADDGTRLREADEVIATRMPGYELLGMVIYAVIMSAISVGLGFAVQALLPTSRPGSKQDESATYRWDGITNTRSSGTPIPLIFGEHRVGGQILQVWRDAQQGFSANPGYENWLNVLLGIGHGPLTSIGSDIQLNGRPLSTYTGVEVITRPGHEDQSAITEFGEPLTRFFDPIIAYSVDARVTRDWRVYRTHGPINRFQLIFSFPEGLFRVKSGGSISVGVLQLEIAYRPTAGSGPWITVTRNYMSNVIMGVTSDPSGITKPFLLMHYSGSSIPVGTGPGEIRVRRTHDEGTAAPFGGNNSGQRNAVHWEEVNEWRAYPAGSAFAQHRTCPGVGLVAIRIPAQDQLSGSLPTITSMVQGLRVPVWNGGTATAPRLRMQHSSNPAWIVAGLLLNRRWGLGNWISPGDIDWTSFKEWADWCDEVVTYFEEQREAVAVTHSTEAVSASATNIVVVGSDHNSFQTNHYVRIAAEPLNVITGKTSLGDNRWQLGLLSPVQIAYSDGVRLARHELAGEVSEPRCRYDAVIDRQQPAWELIQDICRVGRAVPTKLGDKIAIRHDREGTAVQTFSEASILLDSNGSSTLEITYSGSSERVDQQEVHFLDAEQDYMRGNQGTPPLSLSPDANPVIRTNALFGITRATHARREAFYHLLNANLPRKRCRFEVALDGLAAEAGDLIRIGHMMADWSKLTGRANGSLDAMELDHDFTIEMGETYKALVRLPGDQEPTEVTISAAAAAYPAGTPISTDGSTDGLDNSPYIIGLAQRYYTTWRIVNVSITAEMRVMIEAVEYVPAVHALQGAPTDDGEPFAACDGTLSDPPGHPVAPGTYTLSLRESACTPPETPCGAGWEPVPVDVDITPSGAGSGCVTIDSIAEDKRSAEITIGSGCGGDGFCLLVEQEFQFRCVGGGEVPVVDNASSGSVEDDVELTLSHTVGTVDDGALLVGVAIIGDATIDAVEYASLMLLPAGETSHGDITIAWFYLLDPPPGTDDVIVTTSANVDMIVGALTIEHVSQINPIDMVITASGVDDAPATSLDSPVGLVLDLVAIAGDATLTEDAAQDPHWNEGDGTPQSIRAAASSRTGQDGEFGMNWLASQIGQWAAMAIVLRPADAAGPNCEQDYSLCFEHCNV